MTAAVAVAVAVLAHPPAGAQTPPDHRVLSLDIREGFRTDPPPDPVPGAKKSVFLAGVLSAVLPGAGQYYAEAPWWRTLIYGVVEATGWGMYVVYDARNVQATKDFESYADAHWDVTRYIDWIASNYQRWPGENVDKAAVSDALAQIYTSTDPSLPPWERVNFEQLNRIERAVKGGFSHTLPEHGDQQYYEQIGKYFQYRAGWDDHALAGDTLIFDPSRVSARNTDYVEQRERANSYGSIAVTALGAVVLNHIVSMVDAALAARSFNAHLSADMHGTVLPDGRRDIATSITLSVRF